MLLWDGNGKLSPSILVLIAALDEELGIGLTIAELREHLGSCDFLVVDGNSSDNTVGVAKSLDASVIYQQGVGKGDAIAFGLRHVYKDYDYVVLTDADFTYPSEYVPGMIHVLEADAGLGMLCGNRFNHHLKVGAMHDKFYFGNRVLAFTHSLLNGVQLRDPLTGLRVVRWEILKGWKPRSSGFDIEVELNHHVERLGYGIAEVDIPYRARVGTKKLKLRHGFSILARMALESLY